jgi:hypothetical protein
MDDEVIKLPWVEGVRDEDGVYREGWAGELYFRPIRGVMELVGLDIRSVRDPDCEAQGSLWVVATEAGEPLVQLRPRVLTKEVLRKLDLGRLVADRKARSERIMEELARLPTFSEQDLRRRLKQWRANKRPRRGGVPPLPDQHYAEVARVYNKEVTRAARAGLSLRDAKPLKAVRKHFSRKLGYEVTKTTVTTWVSRARQRGLIDPAPARGQVAGLEETR